jgi:glyoxylase-like metal-dependent hydrolase (beta-lactamase superfamily II)
VRVSTWLGSLILAGVLVNHAAAADGLLRMKFNEVKEVAPGVFFRYSAISATNPSIFGGSNNVWVVFDDSVVVIDANFPKEAGDVIAAVKQTTDKPIRYVFDTHQHGDHAWGNGVYATAGAGVIAQGNCARHLYAQGPREFRAGGRGPTGRKDVANGTFKAPTVIFEDQLVLDDGTQRIEFLHLGHGHTAGDAVAYLPRHKILCTGDACVNGAFNYLGDADTASWVRALGRMQKLDVAMVCPGHGPVAGKDLLERQKRYFVELRKHVQQGIDDGKDAGEIVKGLSLPWYKEWTGVNPSPANTRQVYDELTGRAGPWSLSAEAGVVAGPSPTKADPGWAEPRRIVVPDLMPARLRELKRIAPKVEFVPVRSAEEAAKAVEDADAVLGYLTPDVLRAGKRLRWVQLRDAAAGGVDLAKIDRARITVTDTRVTHARKGIIPMTNGEQPWRLWRENVRRFVAGEALLGVVAGSPAELPVVFHDDFRHGMARWEMTDPSTWKVIETKDGPALSQTKQSNYKPPYRSPLNIALVKDVVVGNCILDARCLSTARDYGHRDLCLFFGYQDPAHFYYVHLGKKADAHANQIFIVNGAPRIKISTQSTPGTNWDDQWHHVRVVRRVGDGTIEVFFDDMRNPVMRAKDKTFTGGRVGVGSFDDTGDWRDVTLRGVKVEKDKDGQGR